MLTTFRVNGALVLSPAGARVRGLGPVIAGVLRMIIIGIPIAMRFTPQVSEAVTLLRLTEVILALGAAFLLNNPAASTTVVVPVPRPVQYAAWMTQGVFIAACWWITALIVTRLEVGPGDWAVVPVTGLTLEAVTLLTSSVAAAAWLRSASQGRPGLFAGPALLALVAAMALAPRSANLFAGPGDERWAAMHRVWTLLWIGSLAVLWLASRESSRRRPQWFRVSDRADPLRSAAAVDAWTSATSSARDGTVMRSPALVRPTAV